MMMLAAALALPALVAPMPPTTEITLELSVRRLRKRPKLAPLVEFAFSAAELSMFTETEVAADFDHVVHGKLNVRSPLQAFTVVGYAVSRPQMRAQVEAALATRDEIIAWEEHDGVWAGNPVPRDGSFDHDPRWFVLPKGSYLVVAPPNLHRAWLDADADPDAQAFKKRAHAAHVAARGRRTPLLHVALTDLKQSLRATPAVPIPNDLDLALRLRADHGVVKTRLAFATSDDATAFRRWWVDKVATYVEKSPAAKIAVGQLYADTTVAVKGRDVRLTTPRLSDVQLQLIANTAASTMRREQARIESRRRRREAEKANQGSTSPASR